jgi:membrane protease YdiL (CAAX protease family)
VIGQVWTFCGHFADRNGRRFRRDDHIQRRWYLISLLARLLIFLIAVTILYGFAPLRALAQNWLLLFTACLPALAIMIVLNNVAEEIGWTGFVFARFQDRHGPLRAALSAHCGGRAGGHGRTRLCPIN